MTAGSLPRLLAFPSAARDEMSGCQNKWQSKEYRAKKAPPERSLRARIGLSALKIVALRKCVPVEILR